MNIDDLYKKYSAFYSKRQFINLYNKILDSGVDFSKMIDMLDQNLVLKINENIRNNEFDISKLVKYIDDNISSDDIDIERVFSIFDNLSDDCFEFDIYQYILDNSLKIQSVLDNLIDSDKLSSDSKFLNSLIESYSSLKGVEADLVYDSRKIYSRECNNYPSISNDDAISLVKRMNNGDRSARNKLIESNLRLVLFVAKKYISSPLYSDIVEEGNKGLIYAIDKFDITKGFRLSTYLVFCIDKFIMNYLKTTSMVHIPKKEMDAYFKYKKELKNIESSMGKISSSEKISIMNISKKQLDTYEVIDTVKVTSSISAPLADDDFTLEEVIPDLVDMESDVINRVSNDNFLSLLKNIITDERDLKILALRYGLYGEEIMSYGQIASILGLSRERVRQIELKLIRILSKNKDIRKLSDRKDNNKSFGTFSKDYQEYIVSCSDIYENIYLYFKDSSYLEINSAINVLSSDSKKILNKVYPNGIDKNNKPVFLSRGDVVDYFLAVISPLKGLLQKDNKKKKVYKRGI